VNSPAAILHVYLFLNTFSYSPMHGHDVIRSSWNQSWLGTLDSLYMYMYMRAN